MAQISEPALAGIIIAAVISGLLLFSLLSLCSKTIARRRTRVSNNVQLVNLPVGHN